MRILLSFAGCGTLAKTATFAWVHFGVAFGVAYALTGNIAISGALALVEPLANTVAYYLHERIWRSVGRRHAPEPARA
jgi:uncharacterized membrane protein